MPGGSGRALRRLDQRQNRDRWEPLACRQRIASAGRRGRHPGANVGAPGWTRKSTRGPRQPGVCRSRYSGVGAEEPDVHSQLFRRVNECDRATDPSGHHREIAHDGVRCAALGRRYQVWIVRGKCDRQDPVRDARLPTRGSRKRQSICAEFRRSRSISPKSELFRDREQLTVASAHGDAKRGHESTIRPSSLNCIVLSDN